MRREWMRELAGWLGAVAIALAVAGQVAASARSELLFRDGDSLVVAMFVRSLSGGQHLDWAMSSVLFLPESALFALLSVLPLGVDGLLALNAVVNVLALYGVLRLAAGRRVPGRAPAGWSLVALGVFGLLAATEVSASRDALELSSLLLTTTYYSATVIAVTATVGILRRAFDRTGRGQRLGVALPLALGIVVLISTLSNPLFLAWAAVPLGILLGIGALRPALRIPSLLFLAVLLGAGLGGLLARIPLSAWIAKTGAGYAQPALWMSSLEYYGVLAGERLRTPGGVLAAVILLALLALSVWRSVRANSPGARLTAAAGWVMPLLVVVGAIALGTHAARYLQPAAFAPLLTLVALPRSLHMPRKASLVGTAIIGTLLLAAAALGLPRLQTAVERPDADLACVVDWVDASGRTGGGQFWTVRLPKLHLDDPSRLVQVDHQLRGYAWLVNREDFAVGEVTFLVEDAWSSPWDIADDPVPEEVVSCGRYRILDFAPLALPLGPQRS